MTIIAVGHFLLSMVVLFLGTILLALFSGILAGRDSGNLHIGTAYLVAVLGSFPYLLWGWPSTFAIMAVLTLWTLVGELLNRRDRREMGAASKSNMIDRDKALALAKKHLAENPLPHEDYEWIMSEPFEVDTGWCFDYSFRSRRDVPEEEWEQFGGSPGFLIAKESGAVMILNGEEYWNLKDGLANKSIQATPIGEPDG